MFVSCCGQDARYIPAVRVLVVEDDRELAQILVQGLAEHGIKTVTAHTYDDALSRAALGAQDAIILDVMLPGGDGFRLSRVVRERGITTPILMLTARDAVEDRVRGLESGADDYVTKPFAMREIIARLRALARRPASLVPKRVVVADLEIDLASRRVQRAGRPIELTAKEFALLEFFAQHVDHVLDRAAISAHVWDENHDPFTNVLEVLVRRLRRKIDDGFEPKLIHTLRGAGYRFGK
jgi:DNA-binding response OmpR family regulator